MVASSSGSDNRYRCDFEVIEFAPLPPLVPRFAPRPNRMEEGTLETDREVWKEVANASMSIAILDG